jgi:hypothetical protein
MITHLGLSKFGRFGNTLFQIASTIGIAKKWGVEFSFPVWDERDFFINKTPLLSEFKIDFILKFPMDYAELQPYDNSEIRGFMQSEKYFSHCKELIRYYFEMPEMDVNFTDCAAIHFRGGDYGSNYFPRQKIDYYEKALTILPEKKKYYIFTDDLKSAKKIFGLSFKYISSDNYIEDFMILREFDSFIISNSTFAWWAAWLSKKPNKIIIAPKTWFGQKFNINKTDIYADGFIINC